MQENSWLVRNIYVGCKNSTSNLLSSNSNAFVPLVLPFICPAGCRKIAGLSRAFMLVVETSTTFPYIQANFT
jgi:hypothetical protein